MVYICGKCKFLFERADFPGNCPDCGKEYILPATDDEIKEFEELKKEFGEQKENN